MADTAVADPKVEPKPTETPTPDQIAAQVDDFKIANALFDNPRSRTGWEPKPEEPKVEPPTAPTAPAADEPPAPEPKADDAPTEEPATPPVARDTVTIKKPTADEPPVAPTALPPELPTPPEPAPMPMAGGASPDAHLAEVFSEMERSNPRNRGLANRIKDFRATEAAYQQKWRVEHPGEKFNPAAEEHNDFYAQNEPPFDPAEFRNAERKIERDRIKAEVRDEVRGELEPELNEIRRERHMTKVQPLISKAASEAAVTVLASVAEFEKAMDDGKGNIVRSAEREKAMEEANPVLYTLAAEESDKVSAIVAEVQKMDKVPGYNLNEGLKITLPNGEVIRPHSLIVNALDELEAHYSALPEREQVRNGKRFIATGQRAAYTASVQQSALPDAEKQKRLNDLKNNCWAIDAKDIEKHEISKAKARIQSLAKRIPAVTKKQPDSIAHKNGSNEKPTEVVKPVATTPRGGGSDTVTSSDVVTPRVPGAKSAEKISDVLFGR